MLAGVTPAAGSPHGEVTSVAIKQSGGGSGMCSKPGHKTGHFSVAPGVGGGPRQRWLKMSLKRKMKRRRSRKMSLRPRYVHNCPAIRNLCTEAQLLKSKRCVRVARRQQDEGDELLEQAGAGKHGH